MLRASMQVLNMAFACGFVSYLITLGMSTEAMGQHNLLLGCREIFRGFQSHLDGQEQLLSLPSSF